MTIGQFSWRGLVFAFGFKAEPIKDDDGLTIPDLRWQTYPRALAGEQPHPHGRGPFCEFPIPRGVPNNPGVYVFKIGDRVMYVGKTGPTRGLRKRLAEYHRISPRQSFKGGPRTTCYVNAQVYQHAAVGAEIQVYVLPTDAFDDVERELIHDLGHPPWNLDRCKICGHKNQP